MSVQEKCIEVAMHILWILAKHMKPFTYTNIVKECIIEVENALFENYKKKYINDKKMILSRLFITSRCLCCHLTYEI